MKSDTSFVMHVYVTSLTNNHAQPLTKQMLSKAGPSSKYMLQSTHFLACFDSNILDIDHFFPLVNKRVIQSKYDETPLSFSNDESVQVKV